MNDVRLSFQDLTSSDNGGKFACMMPASGENEQVACFRRKFVGEVIDHFDEPFFSISQSQSLT